MTSTPFVRLTVWARGSPRPRDGAIVAVAGLALRVAVVAWAATRFPPAEDGRYYDVVADRIARGLGYTWLWPDGAVTYAAHYPVGYPAIIGVLYAVLGPRPLWAMAFNGLLGTVAVVAVHRLASVEANRAGAALAAAFIAFHPGLVFYTPALMTEGVSAALLALAAWVSVRAFDGPRALGRRTAALGGAFGVLTLLRPQSVLLAPLYGALVKDGSWRKRCLAATGTLAVAVMLCLPWTIRNCSRMKSCVFVSANAGWNLFIGSAEGATGTWVSLDRLGVPPACRTVWGEAEKDVCFGRAARGEILRAPGRFLALVPKKLAATFDYAGAAGWYLHSSNPNSFDERDKLVLGVAETIWQRLVVLAALCALAGPGPRRPARFGIVALSGVSLLSRAAWIGHVGLLAAGLLLGRRLAARPAAAIAVATVLGTAVTHAVFFGAGRYSLVCFPALAALAGTVLTRREPPEDTGVSKE
jgi:Dolichyl-phosphate-mannose-protein mannosyltransferase